MAVARRSSICVARLKFPPKPRTPITPRMKSSQHLEKLEHFKAYNPTAAQLREAQQREVEVEEADTFSSRQKLVIWLCALVAAGIMIETLFFKSTGAAESKYIFQKNGH